MDEYTRRTESYSNGMAEVAVTDFRFDHSTSKFSVLPSGNFARMLSLSTRLRDDANSVSEPTFVPSALNSCANFTPPSDPSGVFTLSSARRISRLPPVSVAFSLQENFGFFVTKLIKPAGDVEP